MISFVGAAAVAEEVSRYGHTLIMSSSIRSGILITGLPRTGTTALSHLLAADPDTRSLEMWESQQPTPPPEAATYATDPRIAEADARNAPLRNDPDFRRMYDATATSPTENIDLLGQHFRTQHFEGMAHVPSYVRWWLGCDMVPATSHSSACVLASVRIPAATRCASAT